MKKTQKNFQCPMKSGWFHLYLKKINNYQKENKKMTKDKKQVNVVYKVNSVGLILAMIISWSLNKSILWALIHGFFSWFYIIYYMIKR